MCGGIISDSTGKGVWLAAILLALLSLTYNIYPIDFFWLKIEAVRVGLSHFPLLWGMCVMWINISKSVGSSLTGSSCSRIKRSIFTAILWKNNKHVSVDVFIYVCQRGAVNRTEGICSRVKENVLNNTTNYNNQFLPACRENRFEYLLFTQTSC